MLAPRMALWAYPYLIFLMALCVLAKLEFLNGIVGKNPLTFSIGDFCLVFGSYWLNTPMFTDEIVVLLKRIWCTCYYF